MKLFQRLLVAPAALGLMAPMAANADVSAINSEVIEARVDGVEAQLGEVMAGSFSSSTKMSGKAAFIKGYVDDDNDTADSLTFEYMYQLNLNTSFTGEDNLYVRIKTGNVQDQMDDDLQGTTLAAANDNDDVLEVDKFWYQFPLGDSVTVWVGPKIENYYMLASSPSIYKPITKQFALGGNGSAYGSSTQPGFGLAWTQQVEDPSDSRWAVSAGYTSRNGINSAEGNGMFGDNAVSFLHTKIEYGSPRWQISLATSFKENANLGGSDYDGYFHTAAADGANGNITALGLRAYWKPETTGAIPALQFGYDSASVSNAAVNAVDSTAGWMVGLGWDDVLIDGNKAGLALGSRQHATGYNGTGRDTSEDNRVWEAYYTFRVNDGVTVTPAVFGGHDTEVEGADVNGAVLLTEFRF